MGFVTTDDGVRLHYAEHDYTDPWQEAPVVILQHGFGRSSKFWFNIVPHLCRFYRVICPDLRGLGESSRNFDPATGIGLDRYLADLLAIADHVGAKRFHYVGESLGGMLGMVLAAKHPGRVRTLSVLSSSVRPDPLKSYGFGYPNWQDALRGLGPRGWAQAANSATRFPPGTDPGLLAFYSEEFGKSDVEVLVAMSRLAESFEVTPYLGDIKVPVLGVYPTGGAFAKSGQEAILLEKLPHIRIVRLPTRYHMVWALKPAACARQVLHFIAAHDGIPCHE